MSKWTKTDLLVPEIKAVEVLGKEVSIRKLLASEVFGKDRANDKDASFELIANSLVDPVLTVEEAKRLTAEFTNELIGKINDFNGISKAAKEAAQGN